MPVGISDWLLFALVLMVVRIAFTIAAFKAGERHARYRMRARLARWLWSGALHEVRVKKGRLIVPAGVVPVRRARGRRPAQRHKVLSVVRRDDSAAG